MEVNVEELAGGTCESNNKVVVEVVSCPVKGVTVYNDRAEVTRAVSLAGFPAGTTEVSVTGLSARTDRNSVRVSGSKGDAIILEVSYHTKFEAKNKDDGSERGALQRELEQLEQLIAREVEALERINKESEWVGRLATTLAGPARVATDAGGAAAPLFTAQTLEQATSFMQFYQKSLADIDERRAGINHTLKGLREKQSALTKSLGALTAGTTEEVHEVTVLLSTEAPSDLELTLSYVVMGASWVASYDVRVNSDDDRLNLTYYGIITNNSNDHWHDAPLFLSTAQPSVGGAPPNLSTKFVGFVSHFHARKARESVSPWMNSAPTMFQKQFEQCEQLERGLQLEDIATKSDFLVMTADIKESSTFTSFEIPRRSTILSDGKPHKVTIRILQMKARFNYVAIPRLSTHAYLKANIINDSEKYTLLAGDINVFMDGNFVAKSSIQTVSPSESFALFLGTDDAIKVTYPPGVFFNDQQGLLRKTNLKTVKHVITVKNTKAKSVHVSLFDQLPKSNDGQIKVRLLRPTVSEADPSVALTSGNNLKWKLDLDAGKQVQLPFEYQLEWPLGQEINI